MAENYLQDSNHFVFWCPLQKSEQIINPDTGERTMRLGGIASTSDQDSDGEFLDPKGFDIKPLLKNGLVNWHHQAKEHPDTIIGEPSRAEIRPEGLYIETDLYPSSKVAQDVWELAQTLEKDSKTRRLGYSIEGKVTKRGSNDKNSPEYKHILKAIITGVAVTHMPKNPKTFANIIKGDLETPGFDDDDEEENTVTPPPSGVEQPVHPDEDDDEETAKKKKETKALDTAAGAALMPESVDGVKPAFTKGRVCDDLFVRVPGITIPQAVAVYDLILNIAHMNKKTQITEEDIQKAYEALGLEYTDINKGGSSCGGGGKTKKGDDPEEGEEPENKEPDNTPPAPPLPPKKDDDEEDKEPEDKEPEPTQKGDTGEVNLGRLEKALATSHQITARNIKALGVMLKDASNKLEAAAAREADLLDIIKGQEDTINAMNEKINSLADYTPAPKSLTAARPVERAFSKGFSPDLMGGEESPEGGNGMPQGTLSMSQHPMAVAEALDQACFAKGYDEEFGKAVTAFEATHQLPANIIARLKNEFNVEIVK